MNRLELMGMLHAIPLHNPKLVQRLVRVWADQITRLSQRKAAFRYIAITIGLDEDGRPVGVTDIQEAIYLGRDPGMVRARGQLDFKVMNTNVSYMVDHVIRLDPELK